MSNRKKEVWPYNNEILQSKFMDRTCPALKLYLRVLRVNTNVNKASKSQLVATLMDALEFRWKTTGDVGIGLASCDKYLQTVPEATKFWTGHLGRLKNYQPTLEDTLICSLETVAYSRKQIQAKHFIGEGKTCEERIPKPYEKNLINPIFGLNGTNDCPDGYVQLEKGGCCSQIINLVGLWNTKEMIQQLQRHPSGLPIQQIEGMETYMEEGMTELDASLESTTFKSEKEARALMQLVGSLQNEMLTNLASKINSILDSGNELKACETDLLDKYSPSMFDRISDPLIKSFKFLWWLIVKVYKIALGTVKFLVGGIYRILKTVGEKIAWFLVTNPRQCRIILAVAKLFRDKACAWIGERLVEWDVLKPINEFGLNEKAQLEAKQATSFLENANQQLRTSLRDGLTLMKDSGQFDVTQIANKFAQSEYLKTGLGYVGRLSAAALAGIPIIGNILGTTATIINEVMSDSLLESMKFAAETLAYQNDFFETLKLMLDLFNINEALSKMPVIRYRLPGVYWLLQQAMIGTEMAKAALLGGSGGGKGGKEGGSKLSLQQEQVVLATAQEKLNEDDKIANSLSFFNPSS